MEKDCVSQEIEIKVKSREEMMDSEKIDFSDN